MPKSIARPGAWHATCIDWIRLRRSGKPRCGNHDVHGMAGPWQDQWAGMTNGILAAYGGDQGEGPSQDVSSTSR